MTTAVPEHEPRTITRSPLDTPRWKGHCPCPPLGGWDLHFVPSCHGKGISRTLGFLNEKQGKPKRLYPCEDPTICDAPTGISFSQLTKLGSAGSSLVETQKRKHRESIYRLSKCGLRMGIAHLSWFGFADKGYNQTKAYSRKIFHHGNA